MADTGYVAFCSGSIGRHPQLEAILDEQLCVASADRHHAWPALLCDQLERQLVVRIGFNFHREAGSPSAGIESRKCFRGV